jgi:hypothetical protein
MAIFIVPLCGTDVLHGGMKNLICAAQGLYLQYQQTEDFFK